MVKKVIIADDEPSLTRIVAFHIKKEFNVEIDEVGNGQALFDRVRTGEYSLVITDDRMPAMTGQEATRRIREIYDKNQLPIYMMSGTLDEKTALEAGANGFFTKPLPPMPLVMDALRPYLS